MSTPEEHDDIALEMNDEAAPEDVSLEAEEEQHKDKHKKLREQLKVCDTEKMAALEDLQRTKAEFLNSRKRIEEQAARDIARASDSFIIDLLPLCDSFDMAMQDTAAWEAIDAEWRKGVEGIWQQLQSLLKKHNVTAIDPHGEHFDPLKHEAVASEDSDSDSETIINVIQKGYERNDTIIRPAKVTISN